MKRWAILVGLLACSSRDAQTDTASATPPPPSETTTSAPTAPRFAPDRGIDVGDAAAPLPTGTFEATLTVDQDMVPAGAAPRAPGVTFPLLFRFEELPPIHELPNPLPQSMDAYQLTTRVDVGRLALTGGDPGGAVDGFISWLAGGGGALELDQDGAVHARVTFTSRDRAGLLVVTCDAPTGLVGSPGTYATPAPFTCADARFEWTGGDITPTSTEWEKLIGHGSFAWR